MEQRMTHEQATHAALHMTIRLARLVHWLMFVMAHLGLWCLVLTLLWWTGIRPSDISSACLRWLATSRAEFLSAAGLSGATVVGVYWRAVKHVAFSTRHGWLKRYMTKGLGQTAARD
jgi:hypothetical protein